MSTEVFRLTSEATAEKAPVQRAATACHPTMGRPVLARLRPLRASVASCTISPRTCFVFVSLVSHSFCVWLELT